MNTPSSFAHSDSSQSSASTPRTEPYDDLRLSNLESTISQLLCDDQSYVLVTGGLGYIGSHTSLELLKAGHNVIIIDDLSNSHICVLNRIKFLTEQHYSQQCAGLPVPALHFHQFHYGNVEALRSVIEQYSTPESEACRPTGSKIIGVVHFAGFKSVAESVRLPLSYYANNVAAFVNFLETIGDYGIKTLIFSSSAAVYGTTMHQGMETIAEECCLHGPEKEGIVGQVVKGQVGGADITSPYGRTKWICEALLSDLCRSDPEWQVVALRYFNPIGCDPSGLLGEDPLGIPNNLMPVVCKVLRNEISHLNVFGSDYDTKDGTGVRDFIHVTDLAIAHIAALNAAVYNHLRTAFRTFNVGSGEGHSVLELVETMSHVSGKEIPLKFTARRDGDVAMSVARPNRAEKELQWKTERSLLDSCRDTWNFLSKNPRGYRDFLAEQ